MFSRLFFYFKWATYLNQLSAQNEQADLISLGPWWVNEWKGGAHRCGLSFSGAFETDHKNIDCESHRLWVLAGKIIGRNKKTQREGEENKSSRKEFISPLHWVNE